MAVGLAFAYAASFFIQMVFNDAISEIMATFSTAYLGYYVGEELLGVSGLLTVVTIGVTMALLCELLAASLGLSRNVFS